MFRPVLLLWHSIVGFTPGLDNVWWVNSVILTRQISQEIKRTFRLLKIYLLNNRRLIWKLFIFFF